MLMRCNKKMRHSAPNKSLEVWRHKEFGSVYVYTKLALDHI